MLSTNWSAKFEDNSITPLYMYQVKVNDHGIAICNTTFYECHYFNRRNSINVLGNFE